MMKQISIFTENKKGAMSEITGILTENAINIDAMVSNDSAEFGIVRFVLDKPEEAAKAFEAAGYLVKTSTVAAIYMEDGYGELHRLLAAVSDANINLDYIYVTFDRETTSPIAILKSDTDASIIENMMENRGYRIKK